MSEGLKLMVVEDAPIVRMFVESCAVKLGHRIVAAVGESEEALAMLEQVSPDLVLMDVSINGQMDGVELAAKLRNRYHLPVVYLTARHDDQTLARARRTLPVGYVVKPFTEVDLKAALMVAMDQVGRRRDDLGNGYEYCARTRSLFLGGELVPLTSKETSLFSLLYNCCGEVVPYEQINDRVWGKVIVGNAAMRALVLRLRKKVPGLSVTTVTGVGVRLQIS